MSIPGRVAPCRWPGDAVPLHHQRRTAPVGMYNYVYVYYSVCVHVACPCTLVIQCRCNYVCILTPVLLLAHACALTLACTSVFFFQTPKCCSVTYAAAQKMQAFACILMHARRTSRIVLWAFVRKLMHAHHTQAQDCPKTNSFVSDVGQRDISVGLLIQCLRSQDPVYMQKSSQ